MNIIETKLEGYIQLEVDGNLDTNTSPRLQNKLLEAFQKTNNVVVDMGKCGYMSSAGLRAFLMAQKTAASKGGSMKICNVQDSVMNIFEISNFINIFDIEA